MGRGGRTVVGSAPFRLVKSDKVLAYRAHNQHILTGFRPDNDTSLVNALFRLHGQSFNIWSHLAGTIIFVIPRIVLDPSIAGAPWMSLALRLHAAIGAGCGLASAVYHVCESWPTQTYSQTLALDYTMAYVATVSHSCLIAAYETSGHPYLCASLMLPLVALGIKGSLFFFGSQSKSNTTDPRHKVFLTMFMPFLVTVPIIGRALIYPNPLTEVLLRWLLAFVACCSSWLLLLPERFFPPGTFDIVGNSHNVMHVMVLVVWRELHLGIRGLVETYAAQA